MNILAIDPGDEFSGVIYWRDGAIVAKCENAFNPWLVDILRGTSSCPEEFRNVFLCPPDVVAIEQIGHYGTGMPAGKTVFDTCIWIGRFLEAAERAHHKTRLILRATIKAHVCGSARAKDANVAQALRDKYGEKGTKKNPGRTYGVSGHLWSALAIVDYVLCNWEALDLDR